MRFSIPAEEYEQACGLGALLTFPETQRGGRGSGSGIVRVYLTLAGPSRSVPAEGASAGLHPASARFLSREIGRAAQEERFMLQRNVPMADNLFFFFWKSFKAV